MYIEKSPWGWTRVYGEESGSGQGQEAGTTSNRALVGHCKNTTSSESLFQLEWRTEPRRVPLQLGFNFLVYNQHAVQGQIVQGYLGSWEPKLHLCLCSGFISL